ncbi:MAG: cadmium-translocating P-type ATPase, partial [Armatimonadetes bacterium]|nr:cadmium-translocating P-type ATPase [Armatimonadota bacterium]NIO75532.1 cadmium-translocating P-type ATPase [Armatimonadota bacterium]NIO95909.1 cadmium-translocating P-type ATPase [Armatimonadota bacterium]
METRHLSIPLLLPAEGECESCAARLKDALLETKGIASAEIDVEGARLILTFDPLILPLGSLHEQARKAGIEVAQRFGHETLRLADLDCPDCARTLENAVLRIPGVIWAAASVPASRMLVEYDEATVLPEQISESISSLGYRVVGLGPAPSPTLKERLWRNRHILVTGACGLLIAAGFLSGWSGAPMLWATALYLGAVGVGGYRVLRGAISAFRARTVDMNVLMSVAITGAVITGHAGEAAGVIFLFALGNSLEGYTMGRTRRALEALIKLAPEHARVKRGEGEELIPPERVGIGESVIILPGERVPLDGAVVEGNSSLNESAITGESLPVQKSQGDQVWAGSINEYGSLEVRVTRLASETRLARILALIESAEAQKTPTQRMIDRFARYYTPAVILIALSIATISPLALGQPFAPWIYRALALLVVSCPCALVIAAPVALVAAMSAAAREGVLVKGGVYLEEASAVRALALDKTGTLTYGKSEVTDVIGLSGRSSEEVLSIAAAVERRSEHHLGRAVVEAAKKNDIEIPVADEFEALPGIGAKAKVDGKVCHIGSPRLDTNSAKAADEIERLREEGKTAIVLTVEEDPIGVIGLADVPRPEAADAVTRLRELGVSHLTLLTGDNPQTAQAVAASLGLENWRAELLPDEKVSEVKKLTADWDKVAMVGDGINDAPALAASSVGIAMGSAGTDVALETADVVLMGDDLSRLPYLIELGRKTV